MWLVDGVPQEAIAADDRGLQYGDGLFETMALVDGTIRRLGHHMDRLRLGCRRLRLPEPDLTSIEQDLRHVCEEHRQGVVKLIMTRGSGPRGYAVKFPMRVRRLLQVTDWPDHPTANRRQGVCVRVCRTRLGRNSRLAGIKHLNRLEQVLARLEWQEAEIAEGLMLDERGNVIGGTMTNLFAVRNGIVMTPSVSYSGIAGVMRRAVIESGRRDGREVVERTLRLEHLLSADEIFLTNSIIGLWPVRQVRDYRFEAGPVARELAAVCEP